jgi:hypothetical protein
MCCSEPHHHVSVLLACFLLQACRCLRWTAQGLPHNKGAAGELLEQRGYKAMTQPPGGRADNLTQLLQQAHTNQQQQQ